MVWLGVLVGLVVVPVVAAGLNTRARRATLRRAEAGDVVAAWEAIVSRLHDAGITPPSSSTPLEIARATSDSMTGLATGYTKQAYGTTLLDAVETETALDSMRRTDAELRAKIRPLRRLGAAAGLTTIGRRWRGRR